MCFENLFNLHEKNMEILLRKIKCKRKHNLMKTFATIWLCDKVM